MCRDGSCPACHTPRHEGRFLRTESACHSGGGSGWSQRRSFRPGGPSGVCWGVSLPSALGTADRCRVPPAATACDSLSQTWPRVVRWPLGDQAPGQKWPRSLVAHGQGWGQLSSVTRCPLPGWVLALPCFWGLGRLPHAPNNPRLLKHWPDLSPVSVNALQPRLTH